MKHFYGFSRVEYTLSFKYSSLKMFAIEYSAKGLERVLMLILLSLSVRECAFTKEPGIIYILQWTPSNTVPFPSMGQDREAFMNKKCLYQNCFVTDNQTYLNNITEFDALVFNIVELRTNTSLPMPETRSPHQKYVLVSRESAVYYPLPPSFDGYFNWTWTYKLDSDISYKYITVRNKRGNVIGPNKNIQWMNINKMKPTSKYIKRKLRHKTYAAVWFVSNCDSSSKRETFAFNLKEELISLGLDLDVYGSCGNYNCPRDGWEQECHAIIESDYYFYLSFENSFSEDYVTEKLLTALEHFTVPIVLGGANYTRFMPDGIYINACDFGPKELANQMYMIMRNNETYYEYFKWHAHYSFHDASETPDTDGVCEFCALLNSSKKSHNNTSIHRNFSTWWNNTNALNDIGNCTEHFTDSYYLRIQ